MNFLYFLKELYTSGCELRSLPDEKTEVTIILNRNFNGNEDTPFCRQIQAKYVARIIPTLNRSLQIENSSDIKMQYLAKVEIRTLKEIADNFFNQTQWKPLIQENGVQVFAKQLEKDIISATGIFSEKSKDNHQFFSN